MSVVAVGLLDRARGAGARARRWIARVQGDRGRVDPTRCASAGPAAVLRSRARRPAGRAGRAPRSSRSSGYRSITARKLSAALARSRGAGARGHPLRRRPGPRRTPVFVGQAGSRRLFLEVSRIATGASPPSMRDARLVRNRPCVLERPPGRFPTYRPGALELPLEGVRAVARLPPGAVSACGFSPARLPTLTVANDHVAECLEIGQDRAARITAHQLLVDTTRITFSFIMSVRPLERLSPYFSASCLMASRRDRGAQFAVNMTKFVADSLWQATGRLFDAAGQGGPTTMR